MMYDPAVPCTFLLRGCPCDGAYLQSLQALVDYLVHRHEAADAAT